MLDAELVRRRQERNAADRAAWEAATDVDAGADAWAGPGVHPGRVVATLRAVLPDDAIVTTDAGNFAAWFGRGFRFRRPGTFIGPTSGAMGYAVPAAIAAALVHRDRPVVALAGDGGMAMTMAELETAAREGARIIVLVFDNERYGTIRMWQERRGTGEGVATELGPVDFAAIAAGSGRAASTSIAMPTWSPRSARRSPRTARRSSTWRSTGRGSRWTIPPPPESVYGGSVGSDASVARMAAPIERSSSRCAATNAASCGAAASARCTAKSTSHAATTVATRRSSACSAARPATASVPDSIVDDRRMYRSSSAPDSDRRSSASPPATGLTQARQAASARAAAGSAAILASRATRAGRSAASDRSRSPYTASVALG